MWPIVDPNYTKTRWGIASSVRKKGVKAYICGGEHFVRKGADNYPL